MNLRGNIVRKAGEKSTSISCVFYILHELLLERSRQRCWSL